MFTIGVLREPSAESRVSLLPEAVAALVKKGLKVVIETGAGAKAYASDESYQQAGAEVLSRSQVMSQAKVLLSIHAPVDLGDSNLQGKTLIGVYQPLFARDHVQAFAQQGLTCFSLDMLPRTTRAQSMY